jgi:hypothetical protein
MGTVPQRTPNGARSVKTTFFPGNAFIARLVHTLLLGNRLLVVLAVLLGASVRREMPGTTDQSRSRAYRWGEDGLAGISDDQQQLCFAIALWNGRDPILKERLFGLTNSEANHGEDVKEYYFYVDSTLTHSYVKYLYKYLQREFPYRDLVETNGRRSREEFEYELLDTGAFEDDRYFDVFVEYAKGEPEDILIPVSVHNRGPESATLHVLPTLWFRNTWSWDPTENRPVNLRCAPWERALFKPLTRNWAVVR